MDNLMAGILGAALGMLLLLLISSIVVQQAAWTCQQLMHVEKCENRIVPVK